MESWKGLSPLTVVTHRSKLLQRERATSAPIQAPQMVGGVQCALMHGWRPAVQCAGIKVRARHCAERALLPVCLFPMTVAQLPGLLKLGNFTSMLTNPTQEPNVDYSLEIEI